MKKDYVLVAVISPKAADKDKLVEKIGLMVEKMKAKVAKKSFLGTKELVYKIRGQSRGDFWELKIEAELPLKLTDFNLFLNREADIIRYLVLKGKGEQNAQQMS